MKLTIFQADKGDCILLTGADGKHVLVDGGMASSYTRHVAPALGQLQKQKKKLDVVYVSHIDDDHISGVLQMIDDLAAWRVFDHHQKNGNDGFKAPRSIRPPDVRQVWHNAFRDTLDIKDEQIEDMLAAVATILSGSDEADLQHTAAESRDLAHGAASAIRLSARLRPGQLNIPLNEPFDGKLMYLRDNGMPPPIRVGKMRFFVLGPTDAELEKLRTDWIKWLNEHKDAVKNMRREARDAEREFDNDVDRFVAPLLDQAKRLGNRKGITPPNLASLMFLVQEGQQRILLTGDGYGDDLVNGLKRHNKLDGDGTIHVDVLKVQHHGATDNMTAEFPRTVTADHYVFCGNGFMENPELDVIREIIESRVGADRSPNAHAKDPFTLWFNCSEKVAKEKYKPHLKDVEKVARSAAKKHRSKVKVKFLEKGDSLELSL